MGQLEDQGALHARVVQAAEAIARGVPPRSVEEALDQYVLSLTFFFLFLFLLSLFGVLTFTHNLSTPSVVGS